jgi:hypothetical protein
LSVAAACASGTLVGWMLVSAAPAGASLSGKCTAEGTVFSGNPPRSAGPYNPKVVDKVTVPRKGDVKWKGGTGVTGDRAARGEVRVEFPPPVGKVTVGEWGKNGKKVGRPSNSGTYHYSLPSLIAGIKIPVSGEHHEPGIDCVGAVLVTIKGRSPLAWVSLALTVATVMNMSLIMRGKRRIRT